MNLIMVMVYRGWRGEEEERRMSSEYQCRKKGRGRQKLNLADPINAAAV